ncbi:Alcohol dehydrogenase 1; AltName: Full=Alcohol dehydrogenase I [Serendipita indica DSM 11827]|uniref:alcohol dehydrogenase n=1 Tax=Serendipita indica (strain DSM 11827) TaxID=1109443 RepID=G4TC75_SERID|nr:Alcohol dehydrogenase 1; AltName: Full=Alcohol dehydrogenase I [Serendipita indica DSM 11827]CCA68918.1 probable ADH1-alcohol dehydrogenase I [Serendipita indica DSM 11827]
MTIPATQAAVIFEKSNGPLIYKTDWPVTQAKELKPGEALVKITHSGVCHTDLHALKGDWPLDTRLPLVGGHEGVGTIVAIGEGTTTNRKIGDRVGIKWLADSCLDCEVCRRGQEATCSNAVCSGFAVHGTFQQYAVSYVRHLTPIPAGLDPVQAGPILCAGVTVWKAIKQSNTNPGDYILISGAGGGLGHLALQYAAAIGLRPIAVDTGEEKRKLCMELGAEKFIDFRTSQDIKADIRAATDGLGPHAAVIASSSAAAYNDALEYLRNHGTLVAVGLPADSYIKANVFWTVFRALRIVGSYVGNRQDAIEALDFAARGKVKAIVKVQPLKSLAEVYEGMEKGTVSGRIVLETGA